MGELPPPVTVEIDLADGFCNHKCPHCFFSTAQKHDPRYFPLSRARSLAVELAAMGVRAIELPGGGEPTTHPEFIAVVRALAEGGLPIGLVTNGQLAQRITPVLPLLQWVRISMDAGDRTTFERTHGVDQFDKIVSNVKELADRRSTRVGVAFLVTPENWPSIPLAAQVLADAPVAYLQYRPASKVDWENHPGAAQEARALLEATVQEFPHMNIDISSHKWQRVSSGRSFSTCETSPLVGIIKADCSVPFCCLRRNDETRPFGNVLDETFSDIWYSPRRKIAWRNVDIRGCPVPCKHDSYNEALMALRTDVMNVNFL